MIISPVSPYPSFSGNSVRVAQLIEMFLQEGIDIHVVICPISKINSRLTDMSSLEEKLGSKFSIIENRISSINRLKERLLSKLKRLLPQNFYFIQDYTFLDTHIDTLAVKQINSIAEKFKPDIIVAEYVLLSKLFNKISFSAVKVLDSHDRFSERNKRIRKDDSAGLWWSLTHRQESIGLSRADLVFAIQKNESNFFQRMLAKSNTSVLTLDVIAPPNRTRPSLPKQFTIGFVGSNNAHNEQGLITFIKRHWTELRQIIPDLRLVIAGHKYSNSILDNFDNIYQIGNIASLDSFYDECSLIINPCLAGTGLKIKSVEALSYSTPLITTPKGAEGIEDSHNNGAFIAELESSEFKNTIVTLFRDNAKLLDVSTQASKYIEEKNKSNREMFNNVLDNGIRKANDAFQLSK